MLMRPKRPNNARSFSHPGMKPRKPRQPSSAKYENLNAVRERNLVIPSK